MHPWLSPPVPPARPAGQATSRLLSLRVDLYILHGPYPWNHTICGLFSLAAFQKHHVLQDHRWPCHGRCQNFALWLDDSPP